VMQAFAFIFYCSALPDQKAFNNVVLELNIQAYTL